MATPNNIANEVVDAVQKAVSSNDFSSLQSAIDHAVESAANGFGQGQGQGQDAGRKQSNAAASRTQHSSSSGRWSYSYANSGNPSPANNVGAVQVGAGRAGSLNRQQRSAIEKTRYGSPNAQRAGGIGLIIGGVVVVVPVLVLGLIAAFTSSIGGFVIFGSGAIGSAALIIAGVRKFSLATMFDRFRDVIGMRESCAVSELASSCGCSEAKVRSNVKSMIAKGLLKQASLDESTGTLLVTREAAEQHRLAGEATDRRQRQRDLAASVREPVGESAATLSAEQQNLLKRGEGFIAAIREGNDAIAGEEISRTLDQIERLVRAILDTAAERPDTTGDLDQLMDYYLPTTVKLLDAYRELDAQPVQTDNVCRSKREIEGALRSLNTAFEKMLDSLFRDKAIDVSSDISVLHTVLAQEGLVDNPFEKKAGSR